MITEGEAAIPLETTLHAFRNQEKTKQSSTIVDEYAVELNRYSAELERMLFRIFEPPELSRCSICVRIYIIID